LSNLNESIVLVGGGGGVYRVARFLKHIRPNITTIQTVFDHGKHSGTLRDERGLLPPGDIRQAILALADDNLESTLRKLLSFRFDEKGESSLNGATIGNILLAALTEIEGSLPVAINAMCKLCKVRGKVLPVSLDNAELCVKLSDGSILEREDEIDHRSVDDDRTIVSAFLKPNAHIFAEAYDALVRADKIVLCPGDIYTSLVPNLLVDGFLDAVVQSSAKLVYCVNIMTKKAETGGFTAEDFVKVVYEYLGGHRLDFVVFNSEEVDPEIAKKYEEEKAKPVFSIKSDSIPYARELIGAPLVSEVGGIVRHHERIASIIADL
jgi:uncharacterized cofD-like protein